MLCKPNSFDIFSAGKIILNRKIFLIIFKYNFANNLCSLSFIGHFESGVWMMFMRENGKAFEFERLPLI